jgi:hypothetical protein
MRGCRVEIEVVLLDILAVGASLLVSPKSRSLIIGSPSVPQRERKTELLFIVGKTSQAIFAPMVDA